MPETRLYGDRLYGEGPGGPLASLKTLDYSTGACCAELDKHNWPITAVFLSLSITSQYISMWSHTENKKVRQEGDGRMHTVKKCAVRWLRAAGVVLSGIFSALATKPAVSG